MIAIIFGVYIICGKVDFDDCQFNATSQVTSNHDAYRLKTSSQLDHNLTHRSNLFKNPPPPISNRSELLNQAMALETASLSRISRKSSRPQSRYKMKTIYSFSSVDARVAVKMLWMVIFESKYFLTLLSLLQ